MRILIILLSILCFSTFKAQVLKEAQVPAVIRNKVKEGYPSIKVLEWKKAGSRYKVFYVISDSIRATLIYEQSGMFIESEKRIGFQEIPISIQKQVVRKMPGKAISDAFRVVTATGGMSYKLIIDGKEQYFDPQGNLLPGGRDIHSDGH